MTMVTSKYQEAFTIARANFDNAGVHEEVTPEQKLTHPDIYPEDGSKAPFYRPEIRIAFFDLPSLRPSVLFVFGKRSPFGNEEAVKSNIECTGTGVGGSGGARAGRVQSCSVDGGHFFPFESVGMTADALVDWIQAEVERSRREEMIMGGKWREKTGLQKQTFDERWVKEMNAWKGKTPDSKL